MAAFRRVVDARGRSCPLPLAMAKVAIEELEPGEKLLVRATDPEAPLDIGAWAAGAGHGLSVRDLPGEIEIELAKGERPG